MDLDIKLGPDPMATPLSMVYTCSNTDSELKLGTYFWEDVATQSEHNVEPLTSTHGYSFDDRRCCSSTYSVSNPAFSYADDGQISMWQSSGDSPITFNSSSPRDLMYSGTDFDSLSTSKSRRASTVPQQVQESPLCTETASNKEKASADLVSESGITIEIAKVSKYECNFPQCTRGFKRREHLKRHMVEHDRNSRRWTCEHCHPEPKAFSRHDNYITHLRLHVKKARPGARTNYAPAADVELQEAKKRCRRKQKLLK